MLHSNNFKVIIFIINAFNCIVSCSVQIKCFLFSITEKNFNIFSLSPNLKDLDVLEIQLHVKCQGLLIFNATRDERLKKSLKYCTFFMDKELRLNCNTSVKNYTHSQKELPNIISVQLKRVATEYTKFHMVIFNYDRNTEN